MEFTPITKEEFPKHNDNDEFREAIQALEVGTGFSTPCIWKHTVRHLPPSLEQEAILHSKMLSASICPGRQSVHTLVSQIRRDERLGWRGTPKKGHLGRSLRTECKDGILYVLRVGDRVSPY